MEHVIRQIITFTQPRSKYWSHHTQDKLSGKFCSFFFFKKNHTQKTRRWSIFPTKDYPEPAMKFTPPQQLIWLWFRGPWFLLVTHRIRTRYCSPEYQQKFCREFRRKQSQPFFKGYMKGQSLDNCSLTSEGAREEECITEPAMTFKWRFWNAPGGTKITEGATLGRSIELHENIK